MKEKEHFQISLGDVSSWISVIPITGESRFSKALVSA